jgi:hypothetical protein
MQWTVEEVASNIGTRPVDGVMARVPITKITFNHEPQDVATFGKLVLVFDGAVPDWCPQKPGEKLAFGPGHGKAIAKAATLGSDDTAREWDIAKAATEVENEACAKIADSFYLSAVGKEGGYLQAVAKVAKSIEQAIRKRSSK